ncbi:elongation factor P [Sedimentibacter sp. MB31-C6]|uniref:elongation factor P n=1 Tax=Sedimentibacter sp. MB31-C6 TaxID=3109366 RepID=UPI002DDCB003|nr:elongation factor P [Sedimentibacter sp. MB36-C1]WSI03813.1 elongation factor P [Sedimentibacter sp. MB36-C1]
MISANDFKKGITISWNNGLWQIVDFQHVKPGKGAAFVRSKLKNIITGAIREETFNPTEKFPKAHIETKDMQYLYNDGELYYFMDLETFEQIPLNKEQVADAIIYLKENEIATMRFYEGKPFEVAAPNFVELEIVETEPGFKGDTATGANKPATTETGAVITVPLFVEIGDKVKIDTRTGEYLSRV